jgi:hypothetical protein
MSADEIANLLARLETAQLGTPVYDSAKRNWDSTKRLISGQPNRKLIAKKCKTVGKQAAFLSDTLCIHLVRLAHLLKNKGVWSESDDHKKEIINYWNSMKDEFAEGIIKSNAENKTLYSNIMVDIQSEMDIYEIRWNKTFYRHKPKPTHTPQAVPEAAPKSTTEVKNIEWYTADGRSSVSQQYNPNNPIAWTDPSEIVNRVYYINSNSNDTEPIMEMFEQPTWKPMTSQGFRYLLKSDTNVYFAHIHKPTWIK